MAEDRTVQKKASDECGLCLMLLILLGWQDLKQAENETEKTGKIMERKGQDWIMQNCQERRRRKKRKRRRNLKNSLHGPSDPLKGLMKILQMGCMVLLLSAGGEKSIEILWAVIAVQVCKEIETCSRKERNRRMRAANGFHRIVNANFGRKGLKKIKEVLKELDPDVLVACEPGVLEQDLAFRITKSLDIDPLRFSSKRRQHK